MLKLNSFFARFVPDDDAISAKLYRRGHRHGQRYCDGQRTFQRQGKTLQQKKKITSVVCILISLFQLQHDFISPDFWDLACKSEWWPFDDRTCMEVRCTACAPSILSAGAVCDVYKKDLNTIISFRCMQRVRAFFEPF